MSKTYEMEFGGRNLKVIIGKIARQADGAAWVQYGDTVLHVAAVSSPDYRADMNFLPLTVDYREKFYAAGRIPGGFFKREARPHENEIISARLIDRTIRPLFPKKYYYETQVMAVVLSFDADNDPSMLGPLGASLALNVSNIPLSEIVAAVRVALIDGEYIVNPSVEQMERSRLDLVVAGHEKALTMVEGHAEEVSDKELIDGLEFGHNCIKQLVEFQRTIIENHTVPTREFKIEEKDEELIANIERDALETVNKIAREVDKSTRKSLRRELVEKLSTELDPDEDKDKIVAIKETVGDLLKKVVRERVLTENIRLDGRSDTDIRDIECELGLLPRVHGSAIFTRGQTQALVTVTLGTKLDEQRIDSLGEEGYRKYMLHYNFPPYCTGEVKRVMGVSRREVGHGKLGENAIQAVLPDWDGFPYTIRIVSEIMESNGSSSMASICGGSLALMDAGVPIKKAVAGIAMGLIKGEGDDNFKILTDILGDEDALGDMDFKVAGTRDGITAFQMDIKIAGISADLMAKALVQARDARHHILDIMDKAREVPRESLSDFAPKFIVMKIPVDRIGTLIGPGGKMIREIISETGATIDVEDDGTVRIGASDQESGDAAHQWIKDITQVPEEGKEYEGTVKKLMNFGAFVEILPGTEGLLHVSQIDHHRVENVEDYLQVGDKVKVKLLKIDNAGKLDLSRKALLPGGSGDDDRDRDRGRGRDSGGRGGGRSGGGGSRDRGGRR